jgi:hypothetical protein
MAARKRRARTLAGTSRIEVQLRCELGRFFETALDKPGRVIMVAGRRIDPDVPLPEIKVVVEYDGSHWHRDKEDSDRRKTAALTEAGWTVIRLRVAPLEPLGPGDLVVSSQADAHALAVAALEQIELLLGTQIPGLAVYRQEGVARAAAQAEESIDVLLATLTPEERAKRARTLDRLIGPIWRRPQYRELLRLPSELVCARGLFLDELLGAASWHWGPGLLLRESADLQARVALIEQLLGGKHGWVWMPKLLLQDPVTLISNAAHLAGLFGDETGWQNVPVLLAMAPRTLASRAKRLDRRFGSRAAWAKAPALLTRKPETLQLRARLLTRFSGRGWKGTPGRLLFPEGRISANAALLDRQLGQRRSRRLLKTAPSLLGLPEAQLRRRIDRQLAL